MPGATTRTITTTTQRPATASSSPPSGAYVQRGHTVKTVRETETIRTQNKKNGNPIVKTRTRTVYYVDDKPVKLNWFDRLRIRFMSGYEKQAFLAGKLLKQEKKARTGR